MRSRKTYSSEEYAEIRRLLARRFQKSTAEQKRTRRELRDRLGFYISDFGSGLTPSELDELLGRGVIRIRE